MIDRLSWRFFGRMSCWSDFCGCCVKMHIYFSISCASNIYKDYILISVSCNIKCFGICLQIKLSCYIRALHFQFRPPCFFELYVLIGYGPECMIFTRWVPGLTIFICNRITVVGPLRYSKSDMLHVFDFVTCSCFWGSDWRSFI